jgi:hypothetical protein
MIIGPVVAGSVECRFDAGISISTKTKSRRHSALREQQQQYSQRPEEQVPV